MIGDSGQPGASRNRATSRPAPHGNLPYAKRNGRYRRLNILIFELVACAPMGHGSDHRLARRRQPMRRCNPAAG